MRILVTGSAGHLGEGLVRTLRGRQHEVVGVDLLASPFTTHMGSVSDPALMRACMRGVEVAIHTATLHKPHVATHAKAAFVETNVAGTLSVLEAALESGVAGVVFTSTTSAFGAALSPAAGEPAAWVDEEVDPVPKNIYGVTKRAAEDLCELFFRTRGLPCMVLRTSRFFPEVDDDPDLRERYDPAESQGERVPVSTARSRGRGRGPPPRSPARPGAGVRPLRRERDDTFTRGDLGRLREDARGVVRRLFPDYEDLYAERGWSMLPGIDRVYVNRRAREDLGWSPTFDFRHVLDRLRRGEDAFSPLAMVVGTKGYHARGFTDGPYPVAGERCGTAREPPRLKER